MSTIERAAARLGSIGLRQDSAEPKGPLAQGRSPAPMPHPSVGGGFVELDLAALAERGFATPQNAQTPLAVEFRRIKRPLLLNVKQGQAQQADENPPNLIMITSAVPHEGKTFVAANLAMSIAAEVDLSALLVDADVTKGDVTRVLGLQNEYGLSDLLQRGATFIEDAVVHTNLEHFSILPAGRPDPNIDELFASDVMIQVTRALALQNPGRIVILDAAPLLAATEASVLARLVGQVVVVVEADKTPQAKVTEALEHLEGCRSVSLVLNKVSRRAGEAYYGYGYGTAGAGGA